MKTTLLYRFLKKTPAALAFIRAIEAKCFGEKTLVPPVLDIGCGDGLFARIAFPRQIDAAVDLDLNELKLAKSAHQ